MATCPNCGTSSRTDPNAMVVSEGLMARPLGTWSLAGQQLKTSAYGPLYKLSCRCGWAIWGVINGDSFDGYPDTQVWPADTTDSDTSVTYSEPRGRPIVDVGRGIDVDIPPDGPSTSDDDVS